MSSKQDPNRKLPINLKQLSQFVMVSDNEGFERLKSIFISQVPKEIRKIKKAIDEQDRGKLEILAHQMKGSCLTIGANELSALFKSIEGAANLSQFKKAGQDLLEVIAEFQRVKKYLGKLIIQETK